MNELSVPVVLSGNKTLNFLIEFENFVLVLSCFPIGVGVFEDNGHKACRSLWGKPTVSVGC